MIRSKTIEPVTVTRNSGAIQIERLPVTRNVTPPSGGTAHKGVLLHTDLALAQRVEVLEREVAELRRLLTERPAPSSNSRAAYMREYRASKKQSD